MVQVTNQGPWSPAAARDRVPGTVVEAKAAQPLLAATTGQRNPVLPRGGLLTLLVDNEGLGRLDGQCAHRLQRPPSALGL